VTTVWTRVLDLEVPLGIHAEGATGEHGRPLSNFDPSSRHDVEVAPLCQDYRRALGLVGVQASLEMGQKSCRERVPIHRPTERLPQRSGGPRRLAQAHPEVLVGPFRLTPTPSTM
jgi:hypothetical protein